MADQAGSCIRIPKPSLKMDVNCSNSRRMEDAPDPQAERPQDILKDPVFMSTATVPLVTTLAVNQRRNAILVTASIPAEAIITLPRRALEIKRVSKKLFITQSHLLRAPTPISRRIPMDTPKLFLSGFVRKDIQYTQALSQTATTVDADVRDFVVDIPISGVVDLGKGLCLPKFRFDQDQDYENARSERIDLQPTTEIVYCQISEMDNELDRLSLPGGPENEATFTTLQEKMVIVTQLLLTFRTIGYGYMSWPEQTPGNLARIIACHILSKYGIEWIIRR